MNAKDMDKMTSGLDEIQTEIQAHIDELQETFEGKSEKWQESDKGSEFQERIDRWQAAADAIENAVSDLSDAVQGDKA